MERLSAGLRINQAGDDAAGLAISEKMRGQIRGLKQAKRNAQDGISMLQVAEGALSETGSMLQRIRELTVQASTGTNASSDVLAIQDEVQQLLAQIDRIDSDTEFNTMRLFKQTESSTTIFGVPTGDIASFIDGVSFIDDSNLDNKEYTIKVSTVQGIPASVTQNEVTGTGEIKIIDAISYTGSEPATAIITYKNSTYFDHQEIPSENYGGSSPINVSGTYTGSGDKLTVTYSKGIEASHFVASSPEDNAEIVTYSGEGLVTLDGEYTGVADSTLDVKYATTTTEIIQELRGSITLTNVENYTGTTNKFTGMMTWSITYDTDKAQYKVSKGSAGIQYINSGDTVDGITVNIDANISDNPGFVVDIKSAAYMVTVAGEQKRIDVASGSTSATVSGVTVDVFDVITKGDVANGDQWTKSVIAGKDEIFTITDGIDTKKVNVTAADPLEVELSGITLNLELVVTAQDGKTGDTWNQSLAPNNTGFFIKVNDGEEKVMTGEQFSYEGVTLDASEIELGTIQNGDTWTIDFNPGVTGSITAQLGAGQDVVLPVDGGEVTLTDGDQSLTLDFGRIMFAGERTISVAVETSGTIDNESKSDFVLQLGANSGQSMVISFSDMSTAALGVDSINVTADANGAISTVQQAIEKVASERAEIGAYQNRLEHTISNLGTSAENLQAAESRIRDLDMSEEMMNFTKSNILNQAAVAMLAQANMAPQSVLQLLG